MKINSIQSTNFQNRKLTPKIQENVQKLLYNMNQLTEYSENSAKTGWTSKTLCRINLDKDDQFVDKRILICPIKNPQKHSGRCSLHLGKTELEIDANNGEIISYKKPFFKTWNAIFRQASGTLEQMVNKFNNQDIVSRHYIGISGFTKKGIKQLFPTTENIGLKKL